MVTVQNYFSLHLKGHEAECTIEIKNNASVLVHKHNKLLAMAAADGVTPCIDQISGNHYSSGWRPAGVNSRTANAGAASKHLNGHGGDFQDNNKTRALARWCMVNQDKLEECGLWMEDPRWTGGPGQDCWVHLQDQPPASGKRVYIPSTKPPMDPSFSTRFS